MQKRALPSFLGVMTTGEAHADTFLVIIPAFNILSTSALIISLCTGDVRLDLGLFDVL